MPEHGDIAVGPRPLLLAQPFQVEEASAIVPFFVTLAQHPSGPRTTKRRAG
jgi:hypothetical protein